MQNSDAFPMVFRCFSDGFPMVFYGFPIFFYGFLCFFLKCFSMFFPMLFRCFPRPKVGLQRLFKSLRETMPVVRFLLRAINASSDEPKVVPRTRHRKWWEVELVSWEIPGFYIYIYYTHNIWVGEYVILVYVCIDELAQAWFLLYKHDYHMFLFGWEMKINKNRSQAAVDLPLQPVKSDKFKGQPNWCAGNNDWFLRRRQTKVGDAIFDLYDVKLQNFPYSVQSSNPYVMNLYENERNHTWDWDSLSKAGVCVCLWSL